MASPDPNEPTRVATAQDGSVVVMTQNTVTEQEIEEEREDILQRLHTTYVNVVEEMEEFQQQWDLNPRLAFLDAAYEGIKAGGGDWGKSFTDLFEKDTWVAIGDKVGNMAGTAYDAGAQYAGEQFKRIQDGVTGGLELVENADETLMSWAWWQTNIEAGIDQTWHALDGQVQSVVQTVEEAKATVIDSAVKGQKLIKHRDAILDVPNLISRGDVKGIQKFIDTVLMDIDPAMAKQIKNDPMFHAVIEVIQDHDSALMYAAYMSLTLEAIPPNFYAYCSAKYGVQLLLEVVLTLVLAFFTAGAGVAARVATLSARLLSASAKLTGAVRRIKKAQAAIHAFVRLFDDFTDASRALGRLGTKLRRARNRGFVVRGKTKQTLTMKKKTIKRDPKCRLCGSTQHRTPRGKLGNVVYD